jgi:5S rRNA maturation endonuclease (ribonuclease M5)
MYNAVTDFLINSLPAKRRPSQAGWLSFNAPCCHHRGESMDKRSRGGIKTTEAGGVSYHCFNCSFTASYTPGRYLTYKFRKLLSWLGATALDIDRLVIEALRIKQEVVPDTHIDHIELPDFPEIALPEESRSFWELLDFYELASKNYSRQFMDAVKYISDRKINMKDYNFYLTEITKSKLNSRVIIPFYWKDKIVGWTARLMIDADGPKYYTQAPSNYVFNMNKQLHSSKFVIVSEGPFDAMSINGVAVLGNGVTEIQADIIDSLEREVIVVADTDAAGRALIEHALEYGWSVSFPVWRNNVKDVNEAVMEYGQLYVLKSILAAKEINSLKIKLRMRGLDDA